MRDRLIMVEQRQKFQKETLLEISRALQEVVKTHQLVANQRDDIETLKRSVSELMAKSHSTDIYIAESELRKTTMQGEIEDAKAQVGVLAKDIDENIKPQQAKFVQYFKLMGTGLSVLFAGVVTLVKSFL